MLKQQLPQLDLTCKTCLSASCKETRPASRLCECRQVQASPSPSQERRWFRLGLKTKQTAAIPKQKELPNKLQLLPRQKNRYLDSVMHLFCFSGCTITCTSAPRYPHKVAPHAWCHASSKKLSHRNLRGSACLGGGQVIRALHFIDADSGASSD